jgi:protein-S-isoprenylcysteine O-methyltransferase Ste14
MALNRQALVFTVIPLAGITTVMLAMRPQHWDATHITGLALLTLGFVLLTVARAQLGQSFSVTPQARALVTTGLYSKISHPVYVFGTVCVVGGLIYLGRPRLLVAILLIMVPMQILRMRAEGKILEERFGEQYRAWKQQTWF